MLMIFLISKGDMMNKNECALYLSENLSNGREILADHTETYGEILLHVLAGDMINIPLTACLTENKAEDIKTYCKAVEHMWKYGDDDVVNVVDVTVLEYISDDPVIWQRFGSFISGDFKRYINNDVIKNNIMMTSCEPLKY